MTGCHWCLARKGAGRGRRHTVGGAGPGGTVWEQQYQTSWTAHVRGDGGSRGPPPPWARGDGGGQGKGAVPWTAQLGCGARLAVTQCASRAPRRCVRGYWQPGDVAPRGRALGTPLQEGAPAGSELSETGGTGRGHEAWSGWGGGPSQWGSKEGRMWRRRPLVRGSPHCASLGHRGPCAAERYLRCSVPILASPASRPQPDDPESPGHTLVARPAHPADRVHETGSPSSTPTASRQGSKGRRPRTGLRPAVSPACARPVIPHQTAPPAPRQSLSAQRAVKHARHSSSPGPRP